MAAIKGLRSDDNADIVELLGRLGTASMELAHCTDIDAVLHHAGVTLAMPGGEAQLAKWHRLGHLQSVAGGFAEVMAKPSTIATVETHAKKLLLEAKREAEEKAEKEKREAAEQELRLVPARRLFLELDRHLMVIDGRQGQALLDVLILRVQAALVSRLPADSPMMADLPSNVVHLSRRLKQRSVDNACKLAEDAEAAVPQEDLSRAALEAVAERLVTLLSMGFANAFLGAAHGEQRSTVIVLRPTDTLEQTDDSLGVEQSDLASRIVEAAARDPSNVVWRAMLRLGYLDAHLGGKSGLEVATERMETMTSIPWTAIGQDDRAAFGDMLDGHKRSPKISMTLCFDESQNYYVDRRVHRKFTRFVEDHYESNIPMRIVITGSSALLPRLIRGSAHDELLTQRLNAHSVAVRESGVSAPEFAVAAAPGSSFSSFGHAFNMSKMRTVTTIPYLEESEGLAFLRTSQRQHSAELTRFMETLPESDVEAKAMIAPLVAASNGNPRAFLQMKWSAVVEGGLEKAAEAAINDQYRRFRELVAAAKPVPERLVLLKAVGLAFLGKLKPEVSGSSTGRTKAGGMPVQQSSSIVDSSSGFVTPLSLLSAALSASQRLFGKDAAHTKELEGFMSHSSSSGSTALAGDDFEAAADFWLEVGFFRGRTSARSLVLPGEVWTSFAVQLVLAGSALTSVELMALISPSRQGLSDHFERLLAAELLHSGFQAFVSACMARFAPGHECSGRLKERLAATASTDGAAAELVSHRHVAKDGETLSSPPPLEPIMVWGGTSKDPKVVAADKDDEPIKPWQLLKHRHDWGGVDVMVVFAVKDCVYVLLLQSKAREPSLSGKPKEMSAAAAAKLQTAMFNMATKLRSAVVPSPDPGKAWSDIPGKRSLIARIMDNDIAKGCTEMVVCSSVITTKLIKEARTGCDTDLFSIPESPETFLLEEGEPSATGSAAAKSRSVQVWDLRLPADSLVLRKLMTKDMEDALSVCGIELPDSAE
ncbi:hypothetical protein FNF29_04933 [Cafeteria roenbergensis]|uniref:Uncharacterized protein n=1 Tax=Cafeteria roenbergensis TaxID=33653 RepID=A0A5A8CEK2_CAFRO|nr:hypothetical protein FNF29_04933 [Cafeteria roenbergensis]|eukprot:KAA0151047.1 hypothetical protein FNF29_04933 [Cafeteria roenbergensis]